MAGYRLSEDVPTLLISHNIEFELLQPPTSGKRVVAQSLHWWESRLLKPVELERCRKARIVLVTSERERLR